MRIIELPDGSTAEYVPPVFDPRTQKLGAVVPAGDGQVSYEVVNLTPDEIAATLLVESQGIEIITMRQCRRQLLSMGLLSSVNSAITTMGEAAQIDWEYSDVVHKDSPLVWGMVQMLGWSEAETDANFFAASKL